jgi:biopolymer transport protein ExbB/TolQ
MMQSLFWWVWNSIPWYVPVVAIIIAAGFCWQWIAPIWFILPRWLRWAIAFVVALIVAVQYGRNRGMQAERQRRDDLSAQAREHREKIDEQIKALPPNAVSNALRRNGWMLD